MDRGRNLKRLNRTFKRTPVWMRSEDPQLIWDGGLRELRYLFASLRILSGSRPKFGEHPLAGHDLSYEERCAVGAADAFSWLAERGQHARDSRRLANQSQALADALNALDYDAIVDTCRLIEADLDTIAPMS